MCWQFVTIILSKKNYMGQELQELLPNQKVLKPWKGIVFFCLPLLVQILGNQSVVVEPVHKVPVGDL
jgi:hypothetical protein